MASIPATLFVVLLTPKKETIQKKWVTVVDIVTALNGAYVEMKIKNAYLKSESKCVQSTYVTNHIIVFSIFVVRNLNFKGVQSSPKASFASSKSESSCNFFSLNFSAISSSGVSSCSGSWNEKKTNNQNTPTVAGPQYAKMGEIL